MSSDQAKLFVGGISRETSEDALRDHFQTYGTVLGSIIVRDRDSRISRGFGFVRFADLTSTEKALEDKHVILGRAVEVKRAVPKSELVQNRGLSNNCKNESFNHQYKTKKIFVGGLSPNLTEEEFKSYFEKFGRITDVVVMHDNSTQRPRGFGFIIFDLEESVETVVQNKFHDMNGKLVEVKRAVPKEANNVSDENYNAKMGGGRGSVNNHHWSPGILPSNQPFPGYASFVSNFYGGWYPTGAYGTWYEPFIGTRSWPPYYGCSPIYHTYINSGVSLSGHGMVESRSPLKQN